MKCCFILQEKNCQLSNQSTCELRVIFSINLGMPPEVAPEEVLT